MERHEPLAFSECLRVCTASELAKMQAQHATDIPNIRQALAVGYNAYEEIALEQRLTIMRRQLVEIEEEIARRERTTVAP